MEQIKFDFNNMFSSGIGKDHGVELGDIEGERQHAARAHQHLEAVISQERNRIKLALEWTELPFQKKETIKYINALADEITRKYDFVISLGIGGSYLGIKAAQDALCSPYYNDFAALRKKRPRIYFEGNNLDPDTLAVLLKNLDPKKTFITVISKSGETTETKAAFMIVESWLKKGVGAHFGRQIIAITDPDSGTLRKRADAEQEKDILSFRSLPLLKGVGGRFSELNMGLLHLAIVGIDIQEVLDGAKAMASRCRKEDILENPAYCYALLHTILYRKKRKTLSILMPFSETLKSTADWYVQLLAESLGKKYARSVNIDQNGVETWVKDAAHVVNVGRTPVSARGTNDLHSIQQNNIEGENNKAVTFIRVKEFKNELTVPGTQDILSGKKYSQLMNLAQEACEWALVQESRPNCTIILPEVNPYYWGGLLFFFEMATAFEGELLNVNAFDQPGVEGYKNYMYYKLGVKNIPAAITEKITSTPLVKDPKYIL